MIAYIHINKQEEICINMRMIDWMHERGLDIKDLSSVLKINRGYLFLIRRGLRRPSQKLLDKIIKLTNGMVSTFDDLKDNTDVGRDKFLSRMMNKKNETRAELSSHPLDESI